MTINDIATVRTGLVTTRKRKSAAGSGTNVYSLLNLKCISPDNHIDTYYLEPYEMSSFLWHGNQAGNMERLPYKK